MNKEYILSSLKEMIPNPQCELNYTSDYTLLIAILLSAQSLDKNVNKVTPLLFLSYPTLKDLSNADVSDIVEIIKSVGLANNKAKAIKNLSTILINEYDGKVPTNRETLASLPGIGIKTSGVFLVEYYNQNFIPVDTHVKRVSYRLGLTKENSSVNQVEETLSTFFENKDLGNIHQLLVLFGRYICKSKSPNCNKCKFKGMCLLTR